MSLYSKLKSIVVRYAEDLPLPLEPDSVSIIIIEHEKSGGFCVHTATDVSLEDTQTLRSLTQRQYTFGKERGG
jgi:hypothetical protein